MAWNKTSIRSRAIKAFEEKIAKHEADYNTECDAIDAKAKTDKEILADQHVKAIVGNII